MNEQKKRKKKECRGKKKEKKKWEMKNWGKVCAGRQKKMCLCVGGGGRTYSDVFENVAIEF